MSAELALAYSDRAVLDDLMHDGNAAARDLAYAANLAPQATFVVRNLDALHAPRGTEFARR